MKHRMTNTRIYSIWAGMKKRCKNTKCDSYKFYGARGITVCEEWDKDFISFYKWSIENGYNDNLTIDRVDPKGNYEPKNCQWITIGENSKRATRPSYSGVTYDKGRKGNKKYKARAFKDGKHINIGWFENKEEAENAVKEYKMK